MSAENKIKATAKNLEGKVQEAVGDLTGDVEMQAEGKAKQVQAFGMHAAENLKDKAKNTLDEIKGKIDNA
jgi:uncharacterized protein YjbJ (UPF0337 family)